MAIPGITTEDVAIHTPGGKMAFELQWGQGTPATASVVYRCPWPSIIPFISELRGGYAYGPSGDGLQVPSVPHLLPMVPELFCHAVRVLPKDDEINKDGEQLVDPFHHHPHALVTAQYKAPEWSFSATPGQPGFHPAAHIDPQFPIAGCKQRVRANTSFLLMDGAQLKFENSGTIVETSDGIPANRLEFVLEYSRLFRDPTLFLKQFQGKLNNATLWGLPAEHVLFDNFEVSRERTIFGIECSATLTFIGNIGLSWNQRLNKAGQPENVRFVSSTPHRRPFQTTNLHAIFLP